MGIGSPNRIWIVCPVEGKNCGGTLYSRMTVSIPEWNIGIMMGGFSGSSMSLLIPILKNLIGRLGA